MLLGGGAACRTVSWVLIEGREAEAGGGSTADEGGGGGGAANPGFICIFI